MPGKNTYRVGTDGTANYPDLTSIPSEVLSQRDATILLYPGTYTGLTNAVMNDITFVGMGDREEIVINGPITIANTSANTTIFENLTIRGANAAAASAVSCVTKLGAASAPLVFRNVTFANADFAVTHSAELAFATSTRQVTFESCDTTAVDRSIRANANVGVNFSMLNTTANAFFTPGGGSGTPVVTVRASTSAGSNTGNSIRTVLALIA